MANINPPSDFRSFLEICARDYNDAIAVSMFQIEKETWATLTYNDLLEESLAVCRRLRRAGLKQGDLAAILSDTSIEWITHFFGILLAGGTVLPLDYKLTSSELGKIVSHADPRFLLCSQAFLGTAREIKNQPSTPAKIWLIDDASPALEIPGMPELPPVELSGSNIAVICYTSGTSSAPKGVMLAASSLLFEADALGLVDSCEAGRDVILSILPLNHLYGLCSGLLYSLRGGMEICFAHALSPAAITNCLKSRKVTRLLAVPLFARMLYRGIHRKVMETSGATRSRVFALMVSSMSRSPIEALQNRFFKQIHEAFGSTLKQIICGGSELDPETAAFFRGIGIPVYIGYGLTETGPVVAVNTPHAHRKNSVGKILPGVEVQIVKQNPRDLAGEILTRGPNLMKGYFRNPTLSSEALTPDGWFQTGDIGWLDSKGYLYVHGRKKSLIVLSSGKKVHPEEVEGVISRCPLVKEVCVIGVPTATGNDEVVTAVILPNDETLASHSEDDVGLEKLLRSKIDPLLTELAPFKRPAQVILRKKPFVTTTSMKIKRDVLLAELCDRPAGVTAGAPVPVVT